MKLSSPARLAVAVVASFALASGALAQAPAKKEEFVPQVGQAGKDVIWVPTPDELVERMLRMAQVTSNDFVIDLGSGDGRIAIMAAKRLGARAQGIEYNPDMVELSNKSAQSQGVANRVRFVKADIFETDFSQATVITMYLLPGLNLKLRPKLLDMKPGTRISSHQFTMDDWEPDETTMMDGRRAYFWVVPSKVQGSWRLNAGPDQWDMTLDQKYQKIDGNVRLGPLNAGLRETRLVGERIQFALVDGNGVRRDFAGRVTGPNAMEGTMRMESGGEARWSATRR
jgi:SAM-dependent methyltransferase